MSAKALEQVIANQESMVERLEALEAFQTLTADAHTKRLDVHWSVLQRLKIKQMTPRSETPEGRITMLEKGIETLTTAVTKLENRCAGLEDTVMELRDELAAERHRIVTLENAGVDYARRADWLESDVRELQTVSSTHGQEIGNLQSKLF